MDYIAPKEKHCSECSDPYKGGPTSKYCVSCYLKIRNLRARILMKKRGVQVRVDKTLKKP